MGCACQNDAAKVLFYTCSGAANTGELADQVGRTLMRDGEGKMTCLAALGADLSGFVVSAQSVEKNVVLDGCKVACGKKVFERHGLPYEHYLMTDFGVEKGKTPVTPDLIRSVADSVTQRMKK